MRIHPMQLIEQYLSIQGEGLHPGRLTYFVRFARCNLRCVWCDSTYTFGPGKNVASNFLFKRIRESRAPYVCLTGGEPLLHLQDCLYLIRSFPKIHFDIETGGSLDIQPVQFKNSSIIMDWKLKQSGMSDYMKEKNLFYLRKDLDLLKLVTDFSSIERKEIVSLINKTSKLGFPISLQPVYGSNPKKLTEWMLQQKNPRLQINLQIHKIIWPSRRTGV